MNQWKNNIRQVRKMCMRFGTCFCVVAGLALVKYAQEKNERIIDMQQNSDKFKKRDSCPILF